MQRRHILSLFSALSMLFGSSCAVSYAFDQLEEAEEDREYSAGITNEQATLEIVCSEVGVSPEECSKERLDEIAPGASARLNTSQYVPEEELAQEALLEMRSEEAERRSREAFLKRGAEEDAQRSPAQE